MNFCKTMLSCAISLPFYWKDRHEETIFLLFKYISWNNWIGMTLDNPLWIYYYLLNRIGVELDLDNSFWIRKILNFCYLTLLTFGFSHHTISDLGKLNLTILLDIINCLKNEETFSICYWHMRQWGVIPRAA